MVRAERRTRASGRKEAGQSGRGWVGMGRGSYSTLSGLIAYLTLPLLTLPSLSTPSPLPPLPPLGLPNNARDLSPSCLPPPVFSERYSAHTGERLGR
ncbi:hypothetical protein PYCCODRAFT_545543 [Trametes coccinea BRFM310]|uniref:Uncharacterized protein n=1 Tax=Trametes coccinea (strain BRFM310) TaxID=1353009 RepID=A0A1Y2IIV4_TRAC3|nr:hypothetical protein PYCCODRAFT_545543 [Trametes coccinea BRFM310]